MGHTKEPWQVHHDIGAGEWPMVMAGGKVAGVIVANVNPTSFSCATAGNVEMPSAANAHRIVACVNACAGMDDPSAEIERLHARIAELEAQSAIGRRAVEMLRSMQYESGCDVMDDYCPCCWASVGDGHQPDCALAAILRDAEQAESSNSQGILDSSTHFGDATKMVTDRQLADAVNELRDIAIKYHAAGQLRERIAGVVRGLVRGEPGAAVPATGALEALLAAADAVIERWHTPLWKDTRPTAEYIAALRVAADNARSLLAGVGEPATVAVDAGRGPYGGRLTDDSAAQEPTTEPEPYETAVVDAMALKYLKSCVKALDSLTTADNGLSFAICESSVISAARRLLAGGGQ